MIHRSITKKKNEIIKIVNKFHYNNSLQVKIEFQILYYSF